MSRIGDFADAAAERLQHEHVADYMRDPGILADHLTPIERENRNNIFSRLEFRWRSSDFKILEQIRISADVLFTQLYDTTVEAIDDFYGTLKLPEIGEDGLPKRDGSGRVLWQKDSRGQEIEDWSRLTVRGIEKCLLEIERIKLSLAPELNDLLLEAVFAKHIADDVFHDKFAEVMGGTIPERNANAAKHARQDKYFAYFKFYLYSHADAFMKELNNFARILERALYARRDER